MPQIQPELEIKVDASLDVAAILRRHVTVTPIEPTKWTPMGFPGRRSQQIGTAVAVIGMKHCGAYEILLRFPDGKTDSFAPHSLFPVQEQPSTNNEQQSS